MLGLAMNKCEKCGFLHYRTDPCRAAKKSTAARKDVRVTHFAPTGDTQPNGNSGRTLKSEAGTQALPVDTNAGGRPQVVRGGQSEKAVKLRVQVPSTGANEARSSVGERPVVANTGEDVGANPTGLTKFDKKAWQREYMREYMRKRRAAE